MFIDRYKHYLLIAASFALVSCSTSSLSPVHEAKFTFTGVVKNPDGVPIPNAWVKVRGWETVTNAKGEWKQEQVINCGTLREHMDSYEENDAILVMAPGFDSSEEKFIVKHPGWFASCQAEQTIAFNTVLTPVTAAKKDAQESTIPTRKKSKTIPWKNKKPEPNPNPDGGSYSL